jgi:hypothetical protein
MDQQPYSGANLGPLQGGAPPAADDWAAFPEAPKASADSWDAFPEANAVTAGGMAKSLGVGIGKGAIGLVGGAGDLAELAKKGADYVASKFAGDKVSDQSLGDLVTGQNKAPDSTLGTIAQFLRNESAKTANLPAAQTGSGDLPGSYVPPTSAQLQGTVEGITGPFHQPANQAEADAQTAGEFVPAALAGPGGLIRKAVTQVAIPAAATITAGRFSDQNPYVKALAGFVAGGAAALSGPSSAAQVLRSKLPASVTEQDVTRAGQLIEHGRQRGVALTWPEALTRVTGQPVLTDTQRILESHAQTRPAMQEFFADRPGQLDRAARGELDRSFGPAAQDPSMLGPEASRAAETTINGVRGAINRATRPSYDAAGQTLVPNQVHAAMRDDPLFVEALDAVRNDPARNANIRTQSDRSVAVYDAVKKELEERAQRASNPVQPGHSQAVSSATGQMAHTVRQVAIAADRQAAGGPHMVSNYETALHDQAALRRQYLEPLQRGPLGKIADQPDTKRVIDALFPSNPLPASEGEIRDAVGALVQHRPRVAEQLVRAHAEMVFNEAARELQGGASHFSGAKFAKLIAGNSQQRANLQAAIESLPNGHARWEGFEGLLDIMSATGARQPKGSLTSFNDLEVQSMSTGGLQELAAKAASPGKWMSFASDTFKRWSLGRNLDQLARILTSPDSGQALRNIVRIPAGSDRALVMAGRVIGALGAATTDQRAKAN